ncbi:MAG: sensor histidine kinase [Planctomycetota bacterium]|nr:MAG: sensor histidine kinase [Planctomycetota bacterium]
MSQNQPEIVTSLEDLWINLQPTPAYESALQLFTDQLDRWEPLWTCVFDASGVEIESHVASPGCTLDRVTRAKVFTRVGSSAPPLDDEATSLYTVPGDDQIPHLLVVRRHGSGRSAETWLVTAFRQPITVDALLSVNPALAHDAELTILCSRLQNEREFLKSKAEQLAAENESLKTAQAQAVERAIEDHEKRLLAEREKEAMKELVRAIEEADRTKRDFLANMSHELRTPLHAILSYAAFGLKHTGDESSAKLNRYFSQIEKSGKTLLAFVNDLLDFSKLEAGKMTYEFAVHDVAEIVSSVCDELQSLAVQRNLDIRVDAPDGFVRAECDGVRFAQVVRNLVGNAVKFAEEATSILVSIDQDDDKVKLTVKNVGDHIPEKDLERIFEGYAQSRKHAHKSDSTGLGLAICRKLIAQHHGSIWAENVRDGVVFHVQIPVRQDLAAHRSRVDSSNADTSKKTSTDVAEQPAELVDQVSAG